MVDRFQAVFGGWSSLKRCYPFSGCLGVSNQCTACKQAVGARDGFSGCLLLRSRSSVGWATGLPTMADGVTVLVGKRVAHPTVWRFRLLQSLPKGSLKMAYWRLADILANDKTPSYFIHHLATSRCRSIGCSVFRLPNVRRVGNLFAHHCSFAIFWWASELPTLRLSYFLFSGCLGRGKH